MGEQELRDGARDQRSESAAVGYGCLAAVAVAAGLLLALAACGVYAACVAFPVLEKAFIRTGFVLMGFGVGQAVKAIFGR